MMELRKHNGDLLYWSANELEILSCCWIVLTPHGMIVIYCNRIFPVWIIQTRMIQNCVFYYFVNLLTIFIDFSNCRPQHIIFVHIIPQHFINANLKNTFEISVDRFGQDSANSKFINVKTCSVPVIKNLRMSQSMWRWSINRKGGKRRRLCVKANLFSIDYLQLIK